MVDPVHCGLPAPGYSGQCGRLVLCQVSLWPTGTLPGIIVAGTLSGNTGAGFLSGILAAEYRDYRLKFCFVFSYTNFECILELTFSFCQVIFAGLK